MNTRKHPPETALASTDNFSVKTVSDETIVNDYLQLPRVLLNGFREDMTNFMRLHPETEGSDRALRIRLLEAIINAPQLAPKPEPIEAAADSALRVRLNTAEKLLKEAEPLVTPATSKVNTRVKHVVAGTLEWRIGEFLQGRWPRKGEQ